MEIKLSNLQRHVLNSIKSSHEWINNPVQAQVFDEMLEVVEKKLKVGGKVIAFGNGGSATEASHLVGELVGKCKTDNGAWPAICLNDSSALLTCIANDWNYNYIFQRQLEALAQPDDFVIGFTTSGKSKNVIQAINFCSEKNIATSLWTSASCPESNLISAYNIIAPTTETTLAQELHLQIIHALSLDLEKRLGI